MKIYPILYKLFIAAFLIFMSSSNIFAEEIKNPFPNGFVIDDPEVESKCASFSDKMDVLKDICFLCDIFESIFDAMSFLSLKIFDHTKDSLISLIGVVLGLWFAFRLFSQLASGMASGSEFWQSIANTIVRCIIAIAILQAGLPFVSGSIIEPIMGIIFHFANILIENMGADIETLASNNSLSYDNSISIQDTSSLGNPGSVSYSTAMGDGAFPDSFKSSIILMLKNLQNALARGLNIGSSLVCYSYLAAMNSFSFNFTMFLGGIAIYISVLFLLLLVPFFILDALLQLTIVTALLPFFIAAFIFENTKAFTNMGLNMLIDAFMMFLILAVLLGFNIAILNTIYTDILGKVNDSNVYDILNNLALGTVDLFKIIGLCFLSYIIVENNTELSTFFSSALARGSLVSFGHDFHNTLKAGATTAMFGAPSQDGIRRGGAVGTLVKGGYGATKAGAGALWRKAEKTGDKILTRIEKGPKKS